MSLVQHQPWIGPLFQAADVRLLLLGESHHGADPDEVDITVPVVKEWLAGETNPAYRFFTHLAIALSGQEPWRMDRRRAFEKVAFYNYVRKVMSGSRISPSAADFRESEAGFREVLDRLRPTHVMACGKRLWDAMPAFDPPDSAGFHVMLADREFHVGRYRVPNAAPLCMSIRHPQSGFNGRDWHPRLLAFLAHP